MSFKSKLAVSCMLFVSGFGLTSCSGENQDPADRPVPQQTPVAQAETPAPQVTASPVAAPLPSPTPVRIEKEDNWAEIEMKLIREQAELRFSKSEKFDLIPSDVLVFQFRPNDKGSKTPVASIKTTTYCKANREEFSVERTYGGLPNKLPLQSILPLQILTRRFANAVCDFRFVLTSEKIGSTQTMILNESRVAVTKPLENLDLTPFTVRTPRTLSLSEFRSSLIGYDEGAPADWILDCDAGRFLVSSSNALREPVALALERGLGKMDVSQRLQQCRVLLDDGRKVLVTPQFTLDFGTHANIEVRMEWLVGSLKPSGQKRNVPLFQLSFHNPNSYHVRVRVPGFSGASLFWRFIYHSPAMNRFAKSGQIAAEIEPMPATSDFTLTPGETQTLRATMHIETNCALSTSHPSLNPIFTYNFTAHMVAIPSGLPASFEISSRTDRFQGAVNQSIPWPANIGRVDVNETLVIGSTGESMPYANYNHGIDLPRCY